MYENKVEDWNNHKEELSQLNFPLIIPSCDEPEIQRDSLTRHIANSFVKGKESQLLPAKPKSGKTILISQFWKHYSGQTIVYFIDHTPATQNVHSFLYSICCQMANILEKTQPDIKLSVDHLNTYITQYLSELHQLSMDKGLKFYILVDGIEHSLSGVIGKRIIDHLPFRIYPESPYLLLTIDESNLDEIPENLRLPDLQLPLGFDESQTEQFFDGLLRAKKAAYVHKKYEGIPGYLRLVKDAIITNKDYDLQLAPTDLTALLEQQVNNAFSSLDNNYKYATEILAICGTSLPESALSKFCEINDFDSTILNKCSLVRQVNKRYEIVNKEIKTIVCDQVSFPIKNTQTNLLAYLQKNFLSEEIAIDHLIFELHDQDELQKRLQVQPILKTLQEPTLGLVAILNRFNAAVSIAHDSQDIEKLLWAGTGLTIVRRFPDHLIHQGQIDALIALDEWQQAVDRVQLLNDPVTQITTLSRIYSALRFRKIKISDQVLDEFKYKITTLSKEEVDRELLKKIAISILPIFPDLAIDILESEIGALKEQSLVESVLNNTAEIKDDIGDYDVRSTKDLQVFSAFLDQYNYQEFLSELQKFHKTKAKEYVIRKWCSANSKDIHLADAIELWQEAIINDRYFVTPLRCLREMSGLLMNIPIESRPLLIRKLEVPHLFALESPIEEWIQIQTNLAEAMYESDQEFSVNYLKVAYQKHLDNKFDLDQSAYYLARLLLAAKKYYPEIVTEVDDKFHEIFYRLRDNSAKQYSTIRKVLPLLVEIDKDAALIVATELNTFERRTKAIKLVLTESLKKLGGSDLTQLIEDSASATGQIELPRMLTIIFMELTEDEAKISIDNLDKLKSFVDEFNSVELKAESYKNLGMLYAKQSIDKAHDCFNEAQKSWHLLDDMRKKFAIGYEIVEELAEIDLNKAKEFYELVEGCKKEAGSNLAVGLLGIDYVNSINLSMRALSKKYLISQPNIVPNIIEKISIIPAILIKAKLYTTFATTLYRLESIKMADDVVCERLLPMIHKGEHSYEQIAIIQEILPAIFRYSLQEALDLVADIDSIFIDFSCYFAIKWRLADCFLPDAKDIPLSKIQFPQDRQVLDDCCKLASAIDEDYLITITIQLLCRAISTSLTNSPARPNIDQLKAYDLTVNLENIVHKKLPQNAKNIKHDGYKILSLAEINKCRSEIYHYLQKTPRLSPRNFDRKSIKKQWDSLFTQARQIINISDRVLVLSELAELSLAYYGKDGKRRCEDLLNEARDLINQIPALIDRAERLEYIGFVWEKLGDNGQAQFIYKEVANLAQQLDGVDAEQRLRSLVQSASIISDDFADELLQTLDTNRLPSSVISATEIKHKIESLVARPSQSQLSGPKNEREHILYSAYEAWLSSLIVNKRISQEPRELVKQFKESLNYSPSLVQQVAEWCIENIQRGHARYEDIDIQAFVDLAEIVNKISRFATDNSDETVKLLQESTSVVSDKIVSFGAGEYQKAQRYIFDWLRKSVKASVIFCDPYFGLLELLYLQYISTEFPITIITTERGINILDSAEETQKNVVDHWKQITDQELPEITIFIYPVSSEGKFHDRAIISGNNALSIGQSLNGLGKSRGIINLLSPDETQELTLQYISPLLQTSMLRKEHRPVIIEIGSN
ncbi:MAG: hypothetical protein KC423_03220 [Anaerolineales bacterium]|nr:hypothetical protein [Anaerolineales bacterium]